MPLDFLTRECWPWSWVASGGGSPDRSSGRPRSWAYPRRGGPTPSPDIPQASCRGLPDGAPGEQAGAGAAGAVAERGGDDLRAAVEGQPGLDLRAERGEEHVAGLGEATADHD